MGLLSWLFPSPEDRIARARVDLAAGRAAQVRGDLADLERDPAARALLGEAAVRLAKLNLDAAVAAQRLGETSRVGEYLEQAAAFRDEAAEKLGRPITELDSSFRGTGRQLDTERAEAEAAVRRKQADAEARWLAAEAGARPEGLGGDSELAPGRAHDEVEARLALLLEGYPEALRPRVAALGAPFARAVLDLDDARPDLALPELVALPEEPLTLWERARAAHAMGKPADAAALLRRFAELAGGHCRISGTHSGAYLATCTAETGDLAGALRILRGLRAREPEVGGVLYAELLEASGELAEAETALLDLVRRFPKEQQLYHNLARIRLAGGHRDLAIRALEGGLQACGCSNPGKCGTQAPRLDVVRSLATLYLEDGVERDRALELAETAKSLIGEQPTWDDVYLRGLVGAATSAPEFPKIRDMLWQNTPAGDPRRARLAQFLPAAAVTG